MTGEAPEFAGKVALYWFVALSLHGAPITGQPVSTALLLRLHVDAFDTVQDSVSLPPVEGSEVDPAVNDPIDGFCGAT